jgi:hypothetical protein
VYTLERKKWKDTYHANSNHKNVIGATQEFLLPKHPGKCNMVLGPIGNIYRLGQNESHILEDSSEDILGSQS